MNDNEYVLQMKNIRKTFGNLVACDNINFNVRKGTVHALIGENGAGKSTLMNILTCIHKPDHGEIWINGSKMTFRNSLDATKHGVGMVYQEFMLFSDLSIADNIMLGSEFKKFNIFLDRKQSIHKIREICEKYNFNIPIEKKVKDCSVSMLQQVEIVKVLYRGADIIVLDEPTSVLTPQGIEGLFDALRFLKSQGKTIIFISHKLKEVFAIADEITVLRDGKVTGHVFPNDVTEHQLANMMVGREVLLESNKKLNKLGDKILEVKHLSVKDKDGVQRVKDVSFDIKAGEIVGIAGVAGSGQRELVEALFGMQVPESGSEIYLKGKDITSASPRDLRLMGVGYIPQDRLTEGGNAQGTLWENSIMGYHITHGLYKKMFLDRTEVNDFSNRVVQEFNVKCQNLKDKLHSLSGGNIQKLIVGRESIQNNSLLIIEDPTRGIDVGAIEFVWSKLLKNVKEGMGVLLVSHELNEVMQLSDRIFVIYNGKLTEAGRYQELNEKEIGILMMGGAHS